MEENEAFIQPREQRTKHQEDLLLEKASAGEGRRF